MLEDFSFHKDILLGKGAKIRNRYNQVPHLTQDTNGKVTNSQLDKTIFISGEEEARTCQFISEEQWNRYSMVCRFDLVVFFLGQYEDCGQSDYPNKSLDNNCLSHVI